jgi:hypothetical protein
MRKHVGTIAKVSGGTFLLSYQTQKSSSRLLKNPWIAER